MAAQGTGCLPDDNRITEGCRGSSLTRAEILIAFQGVLLTILTVVGGGTGCFLDDSSSTGGGTG